METIKTKYSGDVEIHQSDIFDFPTGLPGFNNETAFIILNLAEDNLFQILQSIHTPDLAFIITDPHQFYPDYEFELDPAVVSQLDIANRENVALAVIVTVNDPFETSSINLKAPLILNIAARKGKQHILQETGHSVKTPLIKSDKSTAKGE